MSNHETVAWAAIVREDGTPCVYPLNDLRPHDLQINGCWCRPFWDDHVIVHNSMDQREAYERGRKMS
jgi:hypothetical protein